MAVLDLRAAVELYFGDVRVREIWRDGARLWQAPHSAPFFHVQPRIVGEAAVGAAVALEAGWCAGEPPITLSGVLTLGGADVTGDVAGALYTIPAGAGGQDLVWTVTASNAHGVEIAAASATIAQVPYPLKFSDPSVEATAFVVGDDVAITVTAPSRWAGEYVVPLPQLAAGPVNLAPPVAHILPPPPPPPVLLAGSPFTLAEMLPAEIAAGTAVSPATPAQNGPNLATEALNGGMDPATLTVTWSDGPDGYIQFATGGTSLNNDVVDLAAAGVSAGDVLLLENLSSSLSNIVWRAVGSDVDLFGGAQAPGTVNEYTVQAADTAIRAKRFGATDGVRLRVRQKDAIPAAPGADVDLSLLFAEPVDLVVSGFPPGLEPVDGVISGASAPTTAGVYVCRVIATNAAGQSVTLAHAIEVTDAEFDVIMTSLVDLDLGSVTQPEIRIAGALLPAMTYPAPAGGEGALAWTTAPLGDDWLLTFDDWDAARTAMAASPPVSLSVELLGGVQLIGGEATFTAVQTGDGNVVINITAPPEYAGEYTVSAGDLAAGPVNLVPARVTIVDMTP